MQWIPGPPDETGLWLVITSTGDHEVWTVSLDRDEGTDHPGRPIDDSGFGAEYLRMGDGDTSEPLADYAKNFPPKCSFGPIPDPETGRTAIHENNIDADCWITKPRPFYGS